MAEQKVYVPTVGEEVANAVSHGVMLCLTLAALPFAAVRAYVHDGTLAAVAASVFVISLLLMFLGSTLYHSMHPASRHKEVFHILDHIFIYVAIAGTYTPIALSVIGGWQGTFITVLQWAMVLFGIIYKSLARRSEAISSVARLTSAARPSTSISSLRRRARIFSISAIASV